MIFKFYFHHRNNRKLMRPNTCLISTEDWSQGCPSRHWQGVVPRWWACLDLFETPREKHAPRARHPPSLDIKGNRKTPAIRRHCLAWERQTKEYISFPGQTKWQYMRSDARTWPTLFQLCDSVDDNCPTLRQHWVLAICKMLFLHHITQL